MKKFLKKNWMVITLMTAGIIIVLMTGLGYVKPEIDAIFSIRHSEKIGNNFIMSIGEESILEWKVEPEIEDVKLEIPKGLEYLGGDLEYKKENEGVRVRAVKVGKWPIIVKTEKADYSPAQNCFVCIGVTDEGARKYCE